MNFNSYKANNIVTEDLFQGRQDEILFFSQY